MLWSITHRFQCLSSSDGQVAHALRTLPPVAARVLLPLAAPRLACVKPAASVHPEPGSNSPLYILYFPGLVQFLRIDALDLLFVRYLLLVLSFSLFNDLFEPCPLRLGGKKSRSFFSSGTAKIRTFLLRANFFQTFFTKIQTLSFYCYIIPPAGIAGAAGAGSGMSTMPHSVVRNIPATDAAFSRATRATLVGSITPASYILTYSSVRAL